MSGPIDFSDFSLLRGSVITTFRPTEAIVRISDCRGVTGFNPGAMVDALSMIRAAIPAAVLRTAFIFDARNRHTWEIHSELKKSPEPRRRTFTNTLEAEAWLSPLLAVPELARLREFLSAAP